VSPGLRPPPLPPQSASPDWFCTAVGLLAGEILGGFSLKRSGAVIGACDRALGAKARAYFRRAA